LESLDLEEVSCFLEQFLSSTVEIPSDLSVDIHSCIGLIQDKLGLVERSLRSLLRALWIQEKVSSDQVHMAVTEHRLGLLYAKAGDYRKAVHLLNKAIAAYVDAKMKPDHNCLQEAEQSLQEFRLKSLESELNDKPIRSQSLTDIFEDGPIAAM
jgi:tetratricopeptide (TPR) repeat protein